MWFFFVFNPIAFLGYSVSSIESDTSTLLDVTRPLLTFAYVSEALSLTHTPVLGVKLLFVLIPSLKVESAKSVKSVFNSRIVDLVPFGDVFREISVLDVGLSLLHLALGVRFYRGLRVR